MRKIWISIAVVLGATIIGLVGIFAYPKVMDMLNGEEKQATDNEKNTAKAESKKADKAGDDREKVSGHVTSEELKAYQEKGLNPFGEKVALNALTDEDYREYIHGMSHQKVVAEKKWGFYEIHPERIEWLLQGLNEDNQLNSAEQYEDILKRWKNEDFSQVDKDHNTIWNLQGGTVGKATGILEQAEEQAYIEKQE